MMSKLAILLTSLFYSTLLIHCFLYDVANADSSDSNNQIYRTRGDVRRSGRFQCQEQEEDIERIQRQAEVQCKCPKIYAPVCANDSKTYHNRCFLQCAAKHKYHRFSKGDLKLESWGPCPNDNLQNF